MLLSTGTAALKQGLFPTSHPWKTCPAHSTCGCWCWTWCNERQQTGRRGEGSLDEGKLKLYTQGWDTGMPESVAGIKFLPGQGIFYASALWWQLKDAALACLHEQREDVIPVSHFISVLSVCSATDYSILCTGGLSSFLALFATFSANSNSSSAAGNGGEAGGEQMTSEQQLQKPS